MLADTSTTLSAGLGEGDAVVAAIFGLVLVSDDHVRDFLFHQVTEMADAVAVVVEG